MHQLHAKPPLWSLIMRIHACARRLVAGMERWKVVLVVAVYAGGLLFFFPRKVGDSPSLGYQASPHQAGDNAHESPAVQQPEQIIRQTGENRNTYVIFMQRIYIERFFKGTSSLKCFIQTYKTIFFQGLSLLKCVNVA